MARVAVVTGGTRGIGAAVAKALKAEGYIVAANYAGNDEAAAAFSKETGIPSYKWDVSDFDACAEGIAKVEASTRARKELFFILSPLLMLNRRWPFRRHFL